MPIFGVLCESQPDPMKPCSLTVCVCKASAVQNVFCNYFAQLCFDSSLNPHNVKNRSPILKSALDTLNAALHLWWSSWLQHWVKAGQRRETAPLFALFSSHIYKHEICSTCRVLCPSLRLCACACYLLSACMGDVRRHRVFAVHDHSERFAVISLLKGGLTTDQHEEDHAQTPDICRDRERMWSVYTEQVIMVRKKTVVFVKRPENKDDCSTK